jgi:hypothetical protein
MTAWPSLSPGSDREHPTRGPSDSDSRACRIIIMMSESLCHRIRLGGTDLDSPGPSYHGIRARSGSGTGAGLAPRARAGVTVTVPDEPS